MVIKLLNPLYLLTEPESDTDKAVAYEVTTRDGLDEVVQIINALQINARVICQDEFLSIVEVDKVTDHCERLVGAAHNTEKDSVFYLFVG